MNNTYLLFALILTACAHNRCSAASSSIASSSAASSLAASSSDQRITNEEIRTSIERFEHIRAQREPHNYLRSICRRCRKEENIRLEAQSAIRAKGFSRVTDCSPCMQAKDLILTACMQWKKIYEQSEKTCSPEVITQTKSLLKQFAQPKPFSYGIEESLKKGTCATREELENELQKLSDTGHKFTSIEDIIKHIQPKEQEDVAQEILPLISACAQTVISTEMSLFYGSGLR